MDERIAEILETTRRNADAWDEAEPGSGEQQEHAAAVVAGFQSLDVLGVFEGLEVTDR